MYDLSLKELDKHKDKYKNEQMSKIFAKSSFITESIIEGAFLGSY
jgi:hypothetical protein